MSEEEHQSSDTGGKHSKSHHGLPSLHLPFHLPGTKHHHHQHHGSTESNQSNHGRSISPIMFLPRRHSHQGVVEDGSHSDNGKGAYTLKFSRFIFHTTNPKLTGVAVLLPCSGKPYPSKRQCHWDDRLIKVFCPTIIEWYSTMKLF